MRLRKNLAALFVLCLLSCTTWFGCSSSNAVGDNPPNPVPDPIPVPSDQGGAAAGAGAGAGVAGGAAGNAGNAGNGAGNGNANGDFTPRNILTGLNNPTRMTHFGGFIFGLVGFSSGQNNGRLIRFALDTNNNNSATDGAQPKTIVSGPTSQLPASFTNPFDLVTDFDNNRMYITDNFSIQGGRVLMVEPTVNALEFNITNLTQNLGLGNQLVNPAFLHFIPPATLFVSEFGGNNVGQVRRIDLTNINNPNIVVFASNLTFPADMVSDGTFLYIAEAGNNAVVRVRLDAGSLPVNGQSNTGDVRRIQQAAGQNQMSQPFELVINAFGDIYVEEGQGIQLGGLAPRGTANGQIQLIRNGQLEAIDIGTGQTRLNGLNNPSGLDVVSLPEQDLLVFTESVNTPNGDVRAVLVNRDDNTIEFNTVIDTGLNEPFDVITSLPGDAERLFYTVNFQGGTPNGSIRGGDFE